ncbi:GrdX family protein [Alkaliphilus serpentinus]|uniref:GrdX protein n=1 Tax=Alkaliphilus serpentinus TaxID=1482731 RepID=A0A833M973_9FIRM|nr:GrdX family protein [Alkaliphilus serpentinus]KAB3529187.1 GrdX protein [Alkaliphilus serpentinus]
MKAIIETNNPLVAEKYKDQYMIDFHEDSLVSVLNRVRDKIHEGHQLLTHPLSGSVKPNETIYKSILLSYSKGELDMNSLMIIESSIETALKLIHMKKPPQWSEKILADFREIDYTLIKSGIESMRQLG